MNYNGTQQQNQNNISDCHRNDKIKYFPSSPWSTVADERKWGRKI